MKLWNQLNHIAEKILPQLFGIHDYPEQRIRGAPFLLPLAEGPVSATASPRFRPAAAPPLSGLGRRPQNQSQESVYGGYVAATGEWLIALLTCLLSFIEIAVHQ